MEKNQRSKISCYCPFKKKDTIKRGAKKIFSGLKVTKMALSDQSDFPAFLRLHKMTPGISSIPEYDNLLSPLPCKMDGFSELTDCRKLMLVSQRV
jgi:hypothetical protein